MTRFTGTIGQLYGFSAELCLRFPAPLTHENRAQFPLCAVEPAALIDFPFVEAVLTQPLAGLFANPSFELENFAHMPYPKN